MSIMPPLSGFVAVYVGDDRNSFTSNELVQMSPVFDDLRDLKRWHSLATGYIDLSRIPQEIIERTE